MPLGEQLLIAGLICGLLAVPAWLADRLTTQLDRRAAGQPARS